MRILVATGIFPPDIGGPATHLAELVPELTARGHAVRVLTFSDAEAQAEPCPAVERVRRGAPWKSWPLYVLAFRRARAWADVCYLHVFGLPHTRGAAPIVLRVPGDPAWERAINRGWVGAGTDIDTFQHGRVDWRAHVARVARSHDARRADRIIVPSEYMRGIVTGWGVSRDRMRVVPSVPGEAGGAVPTRDEARRSLAWSANDRCVLCVARLTPWKGVDLVLRAMQSTPGVRLVVVGDGPMRAALEREASARGVDVSFVGTVSRGQLVTYYAASDYLVLYSGYEGLSHTIVEALRSGLPVIASARGGNPELVRHEVNGLLVAHPVAGALEDALRRAWAPGARERFAAGAATSMRDRCWSGVVDDIVATFAEVVRAGEPVRVGACAS